MFSTYRPGVDAIKTGVIGTDPPEPGGGTDPTAPPNPFIQPVQPAMDATKGRKQMERLQAWARNGGQRMGRRADGTIDYDRSVYADNPDGSWYSGPQYGVNNPNPFTHSPNRGDPNARGPQGYKPPLTPGGFNGAI